MSFYSVRRARGLHDWTLVFEPGLLTWSCSTCKEIVKLTVISAAEPDRLRSTLVILEAPCRT